MLCALADLVGISRRPCIFLRTTVMTTEIPLDSIQARSVRSFHYRIGWSYSILGGSLLWRPNSRGTNKLSGRNEIGCVNCRENISFQLQLGWNVQTQKLWMSFEEAPYDTIGSCYRTKGDGKSREETKVRKEHANGFQIRCVLGAGSTLKWYHQKGGWETSNEFMN